MMFRKLSINQLLFASHLLLVMMLIAGLSYSRYQSEWESRINQEATLIEHTLSPLMREMSLAVAGRNYAALTMPSHIERLRSIEPLLFLDIHGRSDYQNIDVGVHYSRDAGSSWRTDVSHEELSRALQKREELRALLKAPDLSAIKQRKLTFLKRKAEEDITALSRSLALEDSFAPPWPIKPANESKYELLPEHGVVVLQLPLQNRNGGELNAVFDASHLFALKEQIYFTIAVEAAMALFISILLIAWVTHWLVAPLRRLAKQMDKDIERVNIAELDEISRNDEIGVLARGLHALTRKAQSQLKQLKHLSDTDALTGLCGRLNYPERADAMLRACRVLDLNFGVIVCDIDHFKQYNDTFGHSKGDEVIKQIADVLVRTTRDKDLCFRIGGEEFVVLLKVQEAAHLQEIAERMRMEVDALAIPHMTGKGNVTLSVGAVLLPPKHATCRYEEVFNLADQHLYAAKAAGRNCAVFSSIECPCSDAEAQKEKKEPQKEKKRATVAC